VIGYRAHPACRFVGSLWEQVAIQTSTVVEVFAWPANGATWQNALALSDHPLGATPTAAEPVMRRAELDQDFVSPARRGRAFRPGGPTSGPACKPTARAGKGSQKPAAGGKASNNGTAAAPRLVSAYSLH
jgi:hypothetical protein